MNLIPWLMLYGYTVNKAQVVAVGAMVANLQVFDWLAIGTNSFLIPW